MRRRRRSGTLLGGRFRLERLIGTGGMASVWLAEDEQLGREVAVKLLSEALASEPDFAARFLREAQVAARVSHPNLVDIYYFDTSEEHPYLVMEYVERGTLAESIEAGAVIDPRQLARELLGALESIHEAGIIHRDVKPQNVLVGGDGRMRLSDFGIAKPTDATKLTRTGELLGTIRYLAPEVRAGRPASIRSDLYALGILLTECFGEGAPPDVRELAKLLSRDDPTDRPRSAGEALGHLERATRRLAAVVHEKTEPLPTEPGSGAEPHERRTEGPATGIPVDAAAVAERRFVHVSPARVATALLLTAALVLAMLSSAGSPGERQPLLGPASDRELAPDPPRDVERRGEPRARSRDRPVLQLGGGAGQGE